MIFQVGCASDEMKKYSKYIGKRYTIIKDGIDYDGDDSVFRFPEFLVEIPDIYEFAKYMKAVEESTHSMDIIVSVKEKDKDYPQLLIHDDYMY